MIIYIRHSHDSYPDATHAHDHRLSKKGLRLASKMGNKLIRKYGVPNLVLCSPFQRARQTAEQMLIDHQGKKPHIKYDKHLSRFFSRREQKSPDIAPSTDEFDIPIYEDRDKFQKRVDKFLHHINKKQYENSRRVVWVITHALVYKRIAQVLDVEVPEHIPFCAYFKVGERKEKSDSKTAKPSAPLMFSHQPGFWLK